MATGRTSLKNWRVYIDGYDMSGYARSFGPLANTFEEGVDDAISKTVKGTMLGQSDISMGTLNALFDNTATSGFHVIMKTVNAERDVLLACGIQAAPANNDPIFCGQFVQIGYDADAGVNPVAVSVPFSHISETAAHLAYSKSWGVLLHASAARTAANTATGLDETAQTTQGGYMMYQVLAGNGNAAIKVQDASTNSDGSFGDLLSSGNIACAAGVSGVVALARSATVKRYVRWQLALDTATSVTFALAWVRNNVG